MYVRTPTFERKNPILILSRSLIMLQLVNIFLVFINVHLLYKIVGFFLTFLFIYIIHLIIFTSSCLFLMSLISCWTISSFQTLLF